MHSNAELFGTYTALRKSPDDVVISSIEAAEIWKLFRKTPINPSVFDNMSYRAFMQAAIMAAEDASNSLGFLKSLMTSAMSPSATITSILRSLAIEKLKQYRRASTGKRPVLCEAVINMIRLNARSNFSEIESGLEITA